MVFQKFQNDQSKESLRGFARPLLKLKKIPQHIRGSSQLA